MLKTARVPAQPLQLRNWLAEGAVQTMGFRFKIDSPVVPMRLSAFNAGDLHNIVYIFSDQSVNRGAVIGHDLAAVAYVSDEIAVMESGRIVEIGTVEEVYGNPQDPYTKKLVAAVLDPIEDLGAFKSP